MATSGAGPDTMNSNCPLRTELYSAQKTDHWPKKGRHILAQYDDKCIVVYQAFCPEIAKYAVEHGQFGGPRYNLTRMTWIKTNFLWMMYRSGWARKRDQERILAIHLTKEGFDRILAGAKGAGIPLPTGQPDDVRLQWDPDHEPHGGKVDRRAVQLGLRGGALRMFHEEYIKRIDDITSFVEEQREHVDSNRLDLLTCPAERVYIPEDENICSHILLDGFDDGGENEANVKSSGATHALFDTSKEFDVESASCDELMKLAIPKTPGGNSEKSEDVIVCLGGAFNPVHTRHVEVLQTAVDWLEANTKYHVIAGRLAVAPDGYVKNKCKRSKDRCIAAEHRIKMCELACDGHDLIKPYSKTVGSANDCGEKVKRDMHLTEAKIAVILGADRAMSRSGQGKWTSKGKVTTVCVGRKGQTDGVKRVFLEDLRLGLVTNNDFFIVDKELDNVSSTDIRKALEHVESGSGGNDTSLKIAVDDLVEKGWVTENIGKYLLDNFENIYL
ncbi:NMNAT-like protein [Mya arenaria]|uniref:NMNAT-like protein n=1 Tax=Mya arenaria TaxID=6604 RepID=A0ABY7EA06_MYAAR|nr:uncharacterized protein LOC128235266 [Mya arenaria]WAR05999.1 NMNAT-like protein [Mya arenaria]